MEYNNPEIQKQYSADVDFRKKADQLEDQYLYLQAKSTQLQSKMMLSESILELFPADNPVHLYFWYGFMQPPPTQDTTRLTLNFIRLFRPQPDRKFIFVYFNNSTDSSDYYLEFKSIFLLLPLSVLEHMKSFILVRPSFYIRAMSMLGSSLGNSFESYLFFDTCRQFCQKMSLQVSSFATFVPEEIAQQFPEERKQKPALTVFRQNIKGQIMSEKEKDEKREFELSVKSFLAKEVYTLDNFEEGELGIPKIIELLVSYFKARPQGLNLEGIFRKSASIDEQNYVLEQLGQRNYESLNTIENPYLTACLIKRFFYNLKVPLVPFAHYERLVVNPTLTGIKAVVQDLPKKNYLTLMFLLDFLSKDVASREGDNKMSLYSLSVCFSQSLMRAEVQSEQALLKAKVVVSVTNTLMVSFEEIFDEESRKRLLSQQLQDQLEQFERTVRQELSLDMNHRFSAVEYRSISNMISVRQSTMPDITTIEEGINIEEEEEEGRLLKLNQGQAQDNQGEQVVIVEESVLLAMESVLQNASECSDKAEGQPEVKAQTLPEFHEESGEGKEEAVEQKIETKGKNLPLKKTVLKKQSIDLSMKMSSISEQLKDIENKFLKRQSEKTNMSASKSASKPSLPQSVVPEVKEVQEKPVLEGSSPLLSRQLSKGRNPAVILLEEGEGEDEMEQGRFETE